MIDRAVQFIPFTALTGQGEAIEELTRVTEDRLELDEEKMEELNRKMLYLIDRIQDRPAVRIRYFVPDETKEDGSYKSIQGNLRRIDTEKGLMVFEDRSVIDVFSVSDIDYL